MIWACGPPRAGQQVPRGTAWDFSDSVFAIRQTAVGEEVRNQKLEVRLKIKQNPALSKNLRIQYSLPKASSVKLVLYNSIGQVEEVLVDGKLNAGVYEKTFKQLLNNGVYFLRFETEGKAINQKVVVIGD